MAPPGRSLASEKALFRCLFVLGAVVIIIMSASPIRAYESLADFDKRITAELEALNPEAAGIFRQAGEAREKGDHRAAADLYARVQEMVPNFDHAVRRHAYEELLAGNRDLALSLGRKAVEMNSSPQNLSTLASILVYASPTYQPTEPEKHEALGFAHRAAEMDPGDPFIQMVHCQVALVGDYFEVLRHCTNSLLKIAPEQFQTHYFATLLALSENRTGDAKAFLERAKALGLPDDAYRALGAAIEESQPWPARILPSVLKIVSVWAGLFLALLGVGWFLSRAALRAAGRVPAEPTGRAHGLDAALRRIYRVVLWLCSAFYYCSLPLVFLSVLAVGGGLLYGILSFGYVPIKIAAIIAILTLVTLWSILKSLFVRARDEDPGLRLDPAKAPALRAALDEVAGRVGTRPVDNVYLTPGTEVAVMERGGVLRQLAGSRERCLILGIGALEGLPVRPFKAILAHEYGHFSNQDTAGGGFALAVRRSLMTMAGLLAASGAAAWYNPAWLFLNGFHRMFLRISQGASRLQEVLADRWAAFLYGSRSFEEGLRHVISRSVQFQAHASATLKEVSEKKVALANLYTFQPEKGMPGPEIAKAVESALAAPASPYDSHPAPADRFAWVRTLGAEGAGPTSEDEQPVWGLFLDREAIERQLTDAVRRNVRQRYGVEIPAEAV